MLRMNTIHEQNFIIRLLLFLELLIFFNKILLRFGIGLARNQFGFLIDVT